MKRSGRQWASTILVIGLAGHLGVAGRAEAIGPWERWTSDPLSSSQARTPLQAYRDVQIEATFWRKAGSSCSEPAANACSNPNNCFKGLAFWDGDDASPGRFLVRSAFPGGTWCWKTCLLPKTRPDPNGPSICSADAGLNRGGEVALSAAPTVPSPLYSAGFLKAPSGKRNLTTWNGQTSFQWLGDTAWDAPIHYAENRALWKSYVDSRAGAFNPSTSFAGGGGFNNVLVAPAVQTMSAPPANGFRGFVAPATCGSGSAPVVPASCHYWDSSYWRDFDDLVKVANDAGIVLVVADLMDPLNRGGSNQRLTPAVLFPARADATVFARNLASRLAGSFVIFSPSYDARVGDATAETGIKVGDLIEAVGSAIRQAAPRHLVGVHLAGGSALSDYDRFQDATKPWFSLQIFQSGHGGGTCEPGVGNDYAQFACRARKFALRFRCIGEPATNACVNSGAPAGKPIRPAINVEGQYETPGDNETRVQTRHTGWNSGLSGSPGFNIGVYPKITAWIDPSVYLAANHKSDDDLGRMKGLFKSMPWTGLSPRTDMLLEQNNFSGTTCNGLTPLTSVSAKADWLQLWKPHLALDVSGFYGLAYLPRPAECNLPNNGGIYRASKSIAIDRSKANAIGLSCSTWMGKWVSPGETKVPQGGFPETKAKCSDAAGGPVTFSEFPDLTLTCGASCDRVLRLTQRVSSSLNSPNLVATGFSLELEPEIELSEDGLTSTILGGLIRNGLALGEPIPLSGPETRFRKLPSAALDAKGNFLVAWEEENETGSDDIVGARFSSRGEPLGPPFLFNETLEGQQSEPWVSGDDSGNLVAVWTSYSEDDEIAGDIYARVLDTSGEPLGSELLVSSDNLGNQSRPQVQMDGDGGFVVAWTEEPPGDSLDVLPPDATSALLADFEEKAAGRGKSGGVYYRVYDAGGRARGSERRVETGNRGRDRLSRLEVRRHGGFRVRWRTTDASGRDLGAGEQECDRDGNPSGRP